MQHLSSTYFGSLFGHRENNIRREMFGDKTRLWLWEDNTESIFCLKL